MGRIRIIKEILQEIIEIEGLKTNYHLNKGKVTFSTKTEAKVKLIKMYQLLRRFSELEIKTSQTF